MISSFSPQRPVDLVIEVNEQSAAEIAEAFVRARAAQRAWAATPAAARASALVGAADSVSAAQAELADLMVREVGKPLSEARGEVARCVAILRYYAQQVFDPVGAVHEPSGRGLLLTHRRPLGVAGLITPWNFPLAIPLWKAAPALAFGNAVVLKPAPEATACAVRLIELIAPQLPEGLLTCVPGGGSVAGETVVEEADVVSFTGSTATGGIVARAAAQRGVPVQAEMGGQNPAIVLPDADIDAAAAQIANAAMGYAGQKCTATRRVIVVGENQPFRDAFVQAVEGLRLGDPADPDVLVGPVINERSRDRVLDVTADAVRSGGQVLTGGSCERDGWFVAPTVVEGVPADHVLACDEVFGPICLLQDAADLDEAVALANAVPYGLTAGVYTRDLGSAMATSQRLQAGQIKVNAPTTGVDFYLPFGGEKASTFGPREQGKAAQAFFTSLHTITVAPG